MKKILAILSSLTLVSTGVFSTVLACKKTSTPTTKPNPNNNKVVKNNSLDNIKTTSAMLLKQAVLADVYGYNFDFLKSYFNNKNLNEQAKKYKLNTEIKDNITLSTDFEDALANYFSTNLVIKKNDNVNLDGIKGTDIDFLTSVLPKTVFGTTSKQISAAISIILENISGAGITGLLDLAKNIDINSKFSDFVKNLKVSKELITTLLNTIFTNDKFLKELEEEINKFDALTLYKDFELSELSNLALLNILDGINGILDKDYQLVSSDIKKNNGSSLNVRLWDTSKTFINKVTKFDQTSNVTTISSISNSTSPTILPTNIKRNIKTAASLIRGLELFQYLFSLFDDTRKDEFKISDENIFDKSKKNSEFIKNIYKINGSSGGSNNDSKIENLKKNGTLNGSNSQTTLNLKYIIYTLQYYLGNLDKSDKAYRLRQFIGILFSGKYTENSYKLENTNNGTTGTNQEYKSIFFEFNGSDKNEIKEIKLNGFQIFLTSILFESLSNIKLQNIKIESGIFSLAKPFIEKINLKDFFESEVFLKKGLADFLISLMNLITDSFVYNQPLINDNFDKILENLVTILKTLKSDEILKVLFKDSNGLINSLKPLIENYLKFEDISKKIDDFIKNKETYSLVKVGIKSFIPILGNKFFEYIYDGKVEQTFDTLANLTNDVLIRTLVEKLKIQIPAALNFILPYFKKIAMNLRTIFPPNVHLNLKNLFTIKLSDFIKLENKPNFGSDYLDKSITTILNELSGSDGSGSKLKDLDNAYGFKIDSLKELINKIFKYDYKWNDKNPENGNLISLLLNNPDKFKEIIGLTEEGMKKDSNSIIDILSNKLIPNDKDKNQDSLQWFAGVLNKVIINLNKKPNFTTSLEKHFNDDKFNNFEFSETKAEKSGLITSQTISTTINNQKYTLVVTRDPKQPTFIVESLTKQLVQNN
ncbi:MOLPALP family lipoprotein [Mycoplasma mycoides]|uniref:MOLPALP family lipoprotein n=1 Tax=Mycoplasma mycoides TaxID=2102 RepID=UPI0027368630|nr:MOLPALP family lipoprotein [Mycoplasma mycoides]MDP4040290.1 MOLPALP family lipoprotein [Mycoplasma mycoides]MDP4041156.1 MOLPALP family lipoprotein [Mycoplasma mycoides]MDP4042169.1 MOLPALP family lipoprotein [Mycoplasma mycoides]MDP4043571.1 MOLPALP family lipoprotein [Mycoplasma mycoides]MDP4044439.1 MOLPALP family lipoprotein [Mycoplasma mycoides]